MQLDTIHHQLLVAFGKSHRAMVTRTRGFGLLPGHPKVLEYVAGAEGCLQRDIAEVTGLLTRMESLGLVERRPKVGDRRALEIWLTDAGWDAAECVARCGAEVDEIAHTGMSEEEREELSRLLERVIGNFERAERVSAHE